MRRRLTAAIALACLGAVLPATSQGAPTSLPPPPVVIPPPGGPTPLPSGFFGISPQTTLTPADAVRMRAGGIESVRVPVSWAAVQPTAGGGFDWSGLDSTVEAAARDGLQVLPFLYATPRWLTPRPTTLPIDTAREQSAWTSFVSAAVQRYGSYGDFWREHWRGSDDPVPKVPIHAWQIWNEPNFFYFAMPASPSRYARLLQLTHPAIVSADPHAKVILSGLFGRPYPGPPRGMAAADFLNALYRIPGIKADFDGVALHPYALDTTTLESLVEGIHNVMVKNHDRVGLYITEMGWGSQNDFHQVAFEQGIRGQVSELRGAYSYLIGGQRRLNLKQVDWFSWKDIPDACNFCDSVGLFGAGSSFQPKPAWHAFVAITRAAANR